MWIEVESDKERNSVERVKDADYYEAEIIATSCPFCLLTLSDAVKLAGVEEKVKVMDIAEILIGPTEEQDDEQ